MNWLVITSLATAFTGMAVILMLRRRETVSDSRKTESARKPALSARPAPLPARRRRHFYGAEFAPGKACCRAAEALDRRRFLANETPPLPLAGCDAQNCRCLFRPVDDRRSPFDRRERFRAFGDFDADLNRETRSRTDRRNGPAA